MNVRAITKCLGFFFGLVGTTLFLTAGKSHLHVDTLEDYDGAFWFQKQLVIGDDWQGKDCVLELGTIDDYDKTFVNGHLVGETGPSVESAHAVRRRYVVPGHLLAGPDVRLSIRIYDSYGPGGFGEPSSAQMRIYPVGDVKRAIPLTGEWKFRIEEQLPPSTKASIYPFKEIQAVSAGWMLKDLALDDAWVPVDVSIMSVDAEGLASRFRIPAELVRGEVSEYKETSPWPGQYKRPQPLTDADVVGEDGIVYPDFSYAGIADGIPSIDTAVFLKDYDVVDGSDITDALRVAIDSLGENGGAVEIPEGRFQLTSPILIERSNVVIRGAGRDKTTVDLNYGLGKKEFRIFNVADGDVIGDRHVFEVHADPKWVKAVFIRAGDEEIRRIKKGRGKATAGEFLFSFRGRMFREKQVLGEQDVTFYVRWIDGTQVSQKMRLTIQPSAQPSEPNSVNLSGDSMITFHGKRTGYRVRLDADGLRGDRVLKLAGVPANLSVGDKIEVFAHPVESFLKRLKTQKRLRRRCIYIVEAIEGDRVTLNQPLRIDFPVDSQSHIEKLEMLSHCGVEHLSLSQESDKIWTNGVAFNWVYEGWIRDVNMLKIGRNPISINDSKFCEIRDCVFDQTWYNLGHGNGTAYVGFRTSYDCLMEGVTTYGMRHAPTINSSSSGCVVRNSSFHGSDAQLHMDYPHENLFENCEIDASMGTGSYGFGFFAQAPEVRIHGPQGPRNVIYNCRIQSPKSGVWLGGSTENFIIAYNRFDALLGPGIIAKDGAFDNVIYSNVFRLHEPVLGGLFLSTPDCVGWEVIDNLFLMSDGYPIAHGPAELLQDSGNQQRSDDLGEYPIPAVPSLYEWQKARSKNTKAVSALVEAK